jgi:hypothetical protein
MTSKAFFEGNRFLARNLKKEDRKKEFYCDICGEKLIPRMGDVRTWHFSHKNGLGHNSEPETDEHLNMKYFFLDKYEKLGHPTDLEVGIKIGEKLHEADVIVYKENPHTPLVKGVVIECQCSLISENEFTDRNYHYIQNGFIPIWILGEKYLERILKKDKFLSIEEKIINSFGVIFVFEKNKVYFITNNKQMTEMSPEVLLKSSMREIDNLEWMPLQTQIHTNLTFKNGIGYFQKMGDDFLPLLDIQSFIVQMLDLYSFESISKLSNNEKYENYEDLYDVLKRISSKYISMIYKFPVDCWKCHNEIDVLWEGIWSGYYLEDSGIPDLSPKYPTLKRVYSKTMEKYVIGNTCQFCGAYQGNFFMGNEFLSVVYEGKKYVIDVSIKNDYRPREY